MKHKKREKQKITKQNRFEELLSEMKRISKDGFVESFIVECGWDFDKKEFKMIQNRPDKTKPNFITVCTDTLRVMQDNISKNEIIDQCEQGQAKINQSFIEQLYFQQ